MTITKTRVVLSRAQAEWMTARMLKLEKLSRDLRANWHKEHVLLISALHDLALARGHRDPRAFAYAWLKERRVPDDQGLPRRRKEPQIPSNHSAQSNRRGGEARAGE